MAMKTAVEIFKELPSYGITATLTQVKDALATINTESIYAKYRSEYKVELWDKTSPINGIKAEDVVERIGADSDEIYLIYKGNKLIILQPHAPGEVGHKKMDKGVADLHGRKQCDDLATVEADAEILNLVLEKLA